jgi:carboxypeptidase Taq
MSKAYDELLALTRPPIVLDTVVALLHWDYETIMPPKALPWRSEQFALMQGLIHEQRTNPRIGELLDALENETLAGDEAAVVREVRRQYDKAVKLPAAFVEKLARAQVESTTAWKEAREKKEFAIFQPHFETLIRLSQEYARYINPDEDPYQVLFEDYEPGMRIAAVNTLLAEVKEAVVPLIRAIAQKPKPRTDFFHEKLSREVQEPVLKKIAALQGFDFEQGMLAVSTHPFSTWTGGDARITVRYTQGYSEAIAALMHEAGHALYNLGVDQTLPLPIRDDRSLGIHESQSRLWENHIGLARPFWQHLYPQLQEAYAPLADVTLDEWIAARSKVEPTLIRVGADEVTYPLHVILRFEIEQALIRGELAVKDVPQVWNKKMTEYLGVTPANDSEGCMQDIHWGQGSFGYFSTYVLGSMLAAQLYAKAKRDVPTLEKDIASGNCKPLLSWLRTNVHAPGRRYETPVLIERATGKALASDDYITYLTEKYTTLYDL